MDHDLDHLYVDHPDPNLPLGYVVQEDLYSTDPTQETLSYCRSCRLYGSHAATLARSYRSGINLP